MKNRIIKKIKNTTGFSLIEMLMVVLILLLVSSVIAVGIPAAGRAYSKVVDAANAQVLISTAMIRLRDEIGMASDIKLSKASGETDKTIITYNNSLGVKNHINLEKLDPDTDLPASSGDPDAYSVIYIQEYEDFVPTGPDADPDDHTYDTLYHPLVSKAASSERLCVTYSSVDDSVPGIITFNEVTVMNKYTKKPLTDKMTFKVRVLGFVQDIG